MYRFKEVNECKVFTDKETDYFIVSKEFAENLLKEIQKDKWKLDEYHETIQELKLNPMMYLGMKVFVDEDLKGDTFEIR